jgi:hypothetical protein
LGDCTKYRRQIQLKSNRVSVPFKLPFSEANDFGVQNERCRVCLRRQKGYMQKYEQQQHVLPGRKGYRGFRLTAFEVPTAAKVKEDKMS